MEEVIEKEEREGRPVNSNQSDKERKRQFQQRMDIEDNDIIVQGANTTRLPRKRVRNYFFLLFFIFFTALSTQQNYYYFRKLFFFFSCFSLVIASDWSKVFFFQVNKLAVQEIGPFVKKMDETSDMEPAVVDMLFQNGVSLIKNYIQVNLTNLLKMKNVSYFS